MFKESILGMFLMVLAVLKTIGGQAYAKTSGWPCLGPSFKQDWSIRRSAKWGRAVAVLVCCTLMFGVSGTASARPTDSPSDEAIRATVIRYLDDSFRSLVTLQAPDRKDIIDPNDETAVAEAFDEVQVAIADIVGCAWADYTLRTHFSDVRINGNRAQVTVVADTDFHYSASPEVESGVYNVVYEFRLMQTGQGWRIIAIDSDGDDFQRFGAAVADRVRSGIPTQNAAEQLKRERIEDLPRLVDEMRATAQTKSAISQTESELSTAIEPLATFSYSGSNGSTYAQRFAEMPVPSRFFYTVGGNDCTNFVSQCVWAGYGGYVHGNDSTTKNNIANKVRMVPNVWHGGTGGGMPNWESVESFWTYAKSTKTKGPKATPYNDGARYTGLNPVDVRVGDVLQVREGGSGSYGHSVYVSKIEGYGPIWWDFIYVCQHSSDIKNRLASNLIANWGGSDCYMRRLAFSSATFDS